MTSLHWADQLADEMIARSQKDGKPITARSGQTPSGGKHIGNLNDVVRAWFPVKAVRERGVDCRFVHTSDDRDPLKDIPAKIADLDAVWHPSSNYPELKNYLGHPLCRIPDPFGCCKSWSEHFTNIWVNGLHDIGIRPDVHYNNDLYLQGKFDPYIKTVLEKADEAGKISAEFQATKTEAHIPFDAICPHCGMLGNITSFDLHEKTVTLTCGGKAIKAKKTEGCGKTSTVPWSEGKLQWRFEWPAQWAMFDTTLEPFGKDHAEGSWKSGQAIAKRIFNIEPPIPFVYEFFLVNGAKMSASKGNVYIVQDMLKIMDAPSFLFFYAKRPEKQRDFDLTNLYRMVDEFDEIERTYYGLGEERSELREENAKRMYQLVTSKPSAHAPVRVDYRLCAALSQLLDPDETVEKLQSMGHLKGASESDVEAVRERVKQARLWVTLYAADEFKLGLIPDSEAEKRWKELGDAQKAALADFAFFYESGRSEEQLHEEAKRVSLLHGVPVKAFFEAAYLVLLGKTKGPRLMTLVNALDLEEVARRFRGQPR